MSADSLPHDPDCTRDPFSGPDPDCPACTPADQDAQWIRERLDYGNRVAWERLNAVSAAALRDVLALDPLTIRCPLCAKPMLDDGRFDTCGNCAEPR